MSNQSLIRIVVIASLCLCLSWDTFAQQAPPPVLNPKTYKSPSGEFALEVNPSTMHGQGEASYRLARGGKEVWNGKHPFTLWEAIVNDDGTVAGYAYEYGPQGFAVGGRAADPGCGKFHIAIFAPDGKPRKLVSDNREQSNFLHDSPNPLASGMFVDSDRKRLVIRLRNPDINEGGESWRMFDLASGDELANVTIDSSPTTRFIVKAAPVQGSPLVLLHWWQFDPNSRKNPGGAFTLVDLTDPKKPVEAWRQVLAGDYFVEDNKQDRYASDRLMDRMRQDGAILRCDEPHRFDLHFVAEKQRVTFDVARDAGKASNWTVREVSRAAYEMPPERNLRPKFEELASVQLKPLGTLKLGTDKPASTQPVHDVGSFDIDDHGRIGFVRFDRDAEPRTSKFVLIDEQGQALAEPLAFLDPAKDEAASFQVIAWLKENRWIVTASGFEPEAKAKAWFIDFEPEARRLSAKPIEGFEASSVKSLIPTRDGAFAALCDHRYKYTNTHELLCYDKDGKRTWMISSDYGNDSVLFSPQDAAFDPTGGGSIMVLDGIRKVLVVVDLEGKLVRKINLVESFGKEPNYLTKVSVAPDGTIVLHDFQGKPPIWRLRNDGTKIESFTSQFSDGRALSVRELRLGPQDRIWTTDGSAIVRLDAKGVVDQVLGEAPDADSDTSIGAMTVGSDGQIYVAPKRGGIVRVYDSAGKFVRVLKADPKDFSSEQDLRHITVDGDGDVYVCGWGGPHLHLKADGSRVGWERINLDSTTENWLFHPGTRKRWVKGYSAVWLVDESGKAIREIRQRPDGNWLAHPASIAVAPDGSLVVLASSGMRRDAEGPTLNFYSATGDPLRTVALPFGGAASPLAFDGHRAVMGGSSKLLFVNADDGSVRRLATSATASTGPATRSSSRENYYVPTFSADGRELWLVDLDARSGISRYAAPE